MTTTYGTTTGSAAGVGARVALTLLGAAGLIVGAFMEWTASIDGTKLAMKALWTTNFHTTETFVATVGFASIVVGSRGGRRAGDRHRMADQARRCGRRGRVHPVRDRGLPLVCRRDDRHRRVARLGGRDRHADRGVLRPAPMSSPRRRTPSSWTSSATCTRKPSLRAAAAARGHRLPSVPRPLPYRCAAPRGRTRRAMARVRRHGARGRGGGVRLDLGRRPSALP